MQYTLKVKCEIQQAAQDSAEKSSEKMMVT